MTMSSIGDGALCVQSGSKERCYVGSSVAPESVVEIGTFSLLDPWTILLLEGSVEGCPSVDLGHRYLTGVEGRMVGMNSSGSAAGLVRSVSGLARLM
jgi:hypothetical protein